MPSVYFTEEQLEALHAVMIVKARVDWAAFDEARAQIIEAAEMHLKPEVFTIAADSLYIQS